jgi:hypothetical protein
MIDSDLVHLGCSHWNVFSSPAVLGPRSQCVNIRAQISPVELFDRTPLKSHLMFLAYLIVASVVGGHHVVRATP